MQYIWETFEGAKRPRKYGWGVQGARSSAPWRGLGRSPRKFWVFRLLRASGNDKKLRILSQFWSVKGFKNQLKLSRFLARSTRKLLKCVGFQMETNWKLWRKTTLATRADFLVTNFFLEMYYIFKLKLAETQVKAVTSSWWKLGFCYLTENLI